MATCNIKIYKTEITPEKNCIVDNINSYLTSLPPTGIYNNFQYQRIEEEKVIKLPINQSYSEKQSGGNYVDIFQNSKHYYYFITSSKQLAENTVQYNLMLDTLNTFQGDFTFSNKTTVIRQHKNRFLHNPLTLQPNTNYSFKPLIDKTDEGITGLPTVMEKDTVDDTGRLDQNWYLVYKTDNTSGNQPVKVELYPSSKYTLYSDTVDDEIVASSTDFVVNKLYYCVLNKKSLENNHLLIGWYHQSQVYQYETNVNDFYGIIFYKTGSGSSAVFHIAPIQRVSNSFASASQRGYTISPMVTGTNPFFYSSSVLVLTGDNAIIRSTTSMTSLTNWSISLIPDEISTFDVAKIITPGLQHILNIDNVDRTDTKLIKIVECPYCPINITLDASNKITVPSGWIIEDSIIKCTDINTEYIHRISSLQIPHMNINFTTTSIPSKMTKNSILEPKLYHSSISQLKLLYDSYSNEIKREQLTPLSPSSIPQVDIFYKQSNNISSDLLFKWTNINCLYDNIGDYDNYLLSSRNNEISLYTSEYLNYLRTGKYYDEKNRNLTVATTAITTGLAIVGAVVSVATGGSAAPAAIGAVGAIAAGISGTVRQDNAIQQREAQLRQQAANVTGVDNINLLNYYGDGNKLTIREYVPTPRVKEKIFDLFHYCGYADNTQHIPDTDTRYWFNFVQCSPDFEHTGTKPVFEDFLMNIKSKFELGVTYFHRRNNEYDWTQQYENFEKELLM